MLSFEFLNDFINLFKVHSVTFIGFSRCSMSYIYWSIYGVLGLSCQVPALSFPLPECWQSSFFYGPHSSTFSRMSHFKTANTPLKLLAHIAHLKSLLYSNI